MAGRVIAVVQNKGGVGKTTLAVHLAGVAVELGQRVQVLDADPQQASTRWLAEALPEVHVEREDVVQELLRSVPMLARDCDLLVVDGAGNDSEVSRALMLRADLVVLPCAASLLDLRALHDTLEVLDVVRDIRGGRPDAVIAPSRMTRTIVAGEVLETLRDLPVPMLEHVIPQRAAIADAPGQGALTWNLPGAGDAGDALRAACLEILNRTHG